MHLKSLTLKGFKSFAQSTVFSFEPGITCVVGPNGSGKSNVVDALAWVMGEQGPKTLRGGKMDDVIFAGTATKGPLGRAEVSLTIDNSDGALPIEYSEVTITRTLFRSGGSEYAINGEPCRLLDVQELLSDSGLGREMHVIVGQNQLDGVLRASAEERRGFIEEAAGILKHRRRKEKTERKLEAMQVNLTRLQDLAAEVRRQLKPLGQQAEVARKAQGVAAVLRDAKSRLLAADVSDLVKRVELGSGSEAERRAERSIIQELLAEQQARLSQLEGAGLSFELDRARRLDFDFDASAERSRSLLLLASQRVAMLENQEQLDARFDLAALTEQLAEAELLVAKLTAEGAAKRLELEQSVAKRELSRSELDAFDVAMAQQNALVSDFDLELSRLANEMTLAEAKLAGLLAEQERRAAATAEAAQRRGQLEQDFEGLQRQLERTEDSSLQRRYEEAQANQDDLERRLDALRDQLHELEREQDAVSAEHATLNLTLEQKDGTSAVLARQAKGVVGLVAKQLKIAAGYEAAVAAAFGSLSDAILVDSLALGVDVLENALGDQLGQVELVIERSTDNEPVDSAASLADGHAGAIGPLASHVTGPKALLTLLAGFAVVDDISSVRPLLSQVSQGGLKLVTKQGDLITASKLRGGSGARASKLELVAQRDAAGERLRALAKQISKLQGEQAQYRAQFEAARQSTSDALVAIKALDAELAERAEALGRTRAQLEASQSELSRLKDAEAMGESVIAASRQELAEAIQRHDEMASRERPSAITGDRAALEANLEQERQSELQVRVELGAIEERLRVAVSQVAELGVRLEEARQENIRQAEAMLRRDWQLRQSRLVMRAIPELLEALAQAGAVAKARVADQERERTQQQDELIRLRGEVSELQERMSSITQGVHELELENHEARLKLGNLLQRAADELGLDQETLLTEYGPELPIPAPTDDDPSATRPFDRQGETQRLQDAERMLERLGRVNPLALEEYAALEQRHQFLTEQLADLTQTRKDLIHIIKDLDEKMQHIFAAAFEDTQRAFTEVFPKLFPGGSGSIELSNPDDLLTTGIEMTVKPAGKRIDRLSLLSGGERSLAAVAWLIAIFKARPSPFYVLDEVEAALDDANLGRLIKLIEELRQDSQLILVTHQKRTMEIADALYGVSMRSDGVSAVVSQRLSQKAS